MKGLKMSLGKMELNWLCYIQYTIHIYLYFYFFNFIFVVCFMVKIVYFYILVSWSHY